MAVSDRDIESLRKRQRILAAELERTKTDLTLARQQLASENRQALARLRSDLCSGMEQREHSLRAQYEAMLQQTATAQETALESEYRRLQQQYESVTGDLHSALAAEHQRSVELLLRQKNFEQAYAARQQFARETAETCRRTAAHALRQAAETVPLDFFLPGHLALFETRLRDLSQWMDSGFFESVIGISENLTLTLQLDVLEAERQLRRWLHHFEVLRSVLWTQRSLLFEEAQRVPADLLRFSQSRDIHDGIMSEEALAYWSDGAFRALADGYEQTRREIAAFEQDGTLGMEEDALRSYLITHPAQAERFSADHLYRLAIRLTAQLSDTEEMLRRMHLRMRAFEERLALLEALRAALRRTGYPILGTQLLGKPGDPLLLRFCDHLRTMEFEVLLLPVLRRSDLRWINQAVCMIPAECGEARREELLRCLSEVFSAYGIAVPFRELRQEQSVQERMAIAMSDLQLKINGRLN